MIDTVREQYEAYPYPQRNPAEEADRLILGSPSHPVEIDHFLHAGQRDWSRPFRALVAGGGTGDGLIMLAQLLADASVDAEIVYLDLSSASRAIAEARAKARGLEHIRFVTGDLLTAPELGPFDYIDCCGVLHHLPDPDAGFAALRAALREDGGIGAMVYAPHGRAGVYEMQAALRALVRDETPEEKVELAKRLLERLPPTNALVRNPFLNDHVEGGDAGLYDLLLHSQDRAYDVDALYDALERAGLALASFVAPGRYDARAMLNDPDLRERTESLSARERAALAERLSGNLRSHVFYACPAGTEAGRIATTAPDRVPNLIGVTASALCSSIWKEGIVRASFDGLTLARRFPKETAGLLTAIDGKRNLREIRAALGWTSARFDKHFDELSTFLGNMNLLRFSGLNRPR